MRTVKRSKRETWRDWLGNAQPARSVLISRRDLVEYARNIGVDVTENDLRYWQGIGAVPYPVIARSGRTGHAVYPFWFVELVVVLRQMQQQGVMLEDIGPALRTLAPKIAKDGLPESFPTPLRCKCCGQLLPVQGSAD